MKTEVAMLNLIIAYRQQLVARLWRLFSKLKNTEDIVTCLTVTHTSKENLPKGLTFNFHV